MAIMAIMAMSDDLDRLASQLTAFNWNSFTEVLTATIAGAAFAFLGTLLLKKSANRELNDRRNREASIEFTSWMTSGASKARRDLDWYNHLAAKHPAHIVDFFPNGQPTVDYFGDMAAVEKLVLSTTGIINDLALMVRTAHGQNQLTEPGLARVHWPLFSDAAVSYFSGSERSRSRLMDWVRAEEKRRKEEFTRRYDDCSRCAFDQGRQKIIDDIEAGFYDDQCELKGI